MRMEASFLEFYDARPIYRIGVYAASALILAGLIQWGWGLGPRAPASDAAPIVTGAGRYASPFSSSAASATPVVSGKFIPSRRLEPMVRPELEDGVTPADDTGSGLAPKKRVHLDDLVIDPSGDGSSLQPSSHPELESLDRP